MKSLLFSLVLTLTAMSFAQPYLVQDVDQGGTYGGAGFYPGVEFNGWYYYSGSDTISGLELWKSDGDTCILVADLFQGTNSTTGLAEWSDPMQFTVYNNVLYFVARDSIEGYELWEYDGVSSPHLVSWLPYVGANNLANAIYCSMRVYNGSLYIIRNEYNVLYDMYKHQHL